MASKPQQGNPLNNQNRNKKTNPNSVKPDQNKPNPNKRNKPVQNDGPSQAQAVSKKPENKKPSNANNSTDKILQDVLSKLDCSMCLNFLRPPIWMCDGQVGHNICGTCRESLCLPICGICKGTITNQRNYALEGICQQLGSACPNANHGCNFVTKSDNVKMHYEECEFRQYFCPLGRLEGGCMWTGCHNKLLDHFKESHGSNCVLKPEKQIMFPDFDLTKPDKDLQLVVLGRKLFLYHVKIDVGRNVAFWAIQYIGSESQALNWKYGINIYNSKKTKKIIDITEECLSDTVSIDNVFKSGNCIAIPLFVLKNYIHENKKFTFKFFIRSTVPPSKLVSNMKALNI